MTPDALKIIKNINKAFRSSLSRDCSFCIQECRISSGNVTFDCRSDVMRGQSAGCWAVLCLVLT